MFSYIGPCFLILIHLPNFNCLDSDFFASHLPQADFFENFLGRALSLLMFATVLFILQLRTRVSLQWLLWAIADQLGISLSKTKSTGKTISLLVVVEKSS